MREVFGFRFSVVLLAVVLASPVSPAAADSAAQDAAYGAGSVFSTLLYAPFKATFCILGGITSVFTLPFGGPRTTGNVASAACGGTWAITPRALKGEEPVRFIGGDSSQSSEHRPSTTK